MEANSAQPGLRAGSAPRRSLVVCHGVSSDAVPQRTDTPLYQQRHAMAGVGAGRSADARPCLLTWVAPSPMLRAQSDCVRYRGIA